MIINNVLNILLIAFDCSKKQGGNSNLDCVPRTAIVAMSDGEGEEQGGRGVPSFKFVHQMCHQGGGGSISQILPKTLAGYISATKCDIAFKFSQNVGHN